jgi:lipopolysaccharide export system protein LptC
MPAQRQESLARAARERSIERWRRRSATIRVLRVLTPGAIAAIIVGLGASVAYNAMKPSGEAAAETNRPIRLINPRFVGRDEQGRAFVITAASATRDPQEYQKVYLDKPALVVDEQGPDPTRLTAASGVFHENTGKLEVGGGVRMASSQQTFETASSQFDTKTGDLIGSGPIHGSGALGEMSAKSYSVHDKGDRFIFQGDVRSRLYPKR